MSTVKTDSTSAGTAPGVSESPPAARASILLVDDQPARLLSYEAILLGLEMHCVRALSGTQALEKLLEQEFAAILLDVNMPEMDGFETAEWLQKNFSKIYVLMLTMFDSELSLIRLLQTGVRGFLKKDIHPSELKFAIHGYQAG